MSERLAVLREVRARWAESDGYGMDVLDAMIAEAQPKPIVWELSFLKPTPETDINKPCLVYWKDGECRVRGVPKLGARVSLGGDILLYAVLPTLADLGAGA